MPACALVGGFRGSGSNLYIARADMEGNWTPGKLIPKQGAYIGYSWKEYFRRNYQVSIDVYFTSFLN